MKQILKKFQINGFTLKNKERWYYVQKTEVVSAYFYLGITLDVLGGWAET